VVNAVSGGETGCRSGMTGICLYCTCKVAASYITCFVLLKKVSSLRRHKARITFIPNTSDTCRSRYCVVDIN
jgi:hypothetical protein